MITSSIQRIVRGGDRLLSSVYLSLFKERGGLIALLFHSLFQDEREISKNLVDPLERTTVRQFSRLIQYYLDCGYQFVTPDEVLAGLDPNGKHALITFDDGYFNNRRALPVLDEFEVPAVFFISTEHVRQNKCFWWDVLYRESIARGLSEDEIYRTGVATKLLRTEAIEHRLKSEFGEDCLIPRGDVDRPFSPAELREFAAHPRVHLGNHTANHAILPNYTIDEARDQIMQAQQYLLETTGRAPNLIAYPNGAQNPAVVELCRSLGLQLGFTICPKKSRLPLENGANSRGMFEVGRFVPHNQSPIESQCRTFRSDWQMYRLFRHGYLWWTRGQRTA